MADDRVSRRLSVSDTEAIIEALGGTKAVADLFRISLPSVSAWKVRGMPELRAQLLQARFPKIPAIKATITR